MEPKKAAKIFKALSNPNRLELYLKIMECHESEFDAGCECFLINIMNSFSIGAPTISHHIKELVNAGLIETEKKGKLLICRVNQDIVEEVFQLVFHK
ncbi:ArsR/SmtB family transcription factor [Desulfovibrio cuneatus]|uniref:ArsR/SmtB family transcription factor n=1 Tax=Desulfovibrio cuneatus TaxID=159728 RepID=UPI0004809659|nr:metalloregulator ArsR/SmtB family transcription factor [Desulfovibrio cuneatus]